MQSINQNPLQFTPEKTIKVVLVVGWLFFALAMILLYYSLQAESSYQEEQSYNNYWSLAMGFSLLFFSLFVYNFLTMKLQVENGKITFTSFLRTRSLLISDIKGARKIGTHTDRNGSINGKPVFIPKKNSKGKKISTFQNKELVLWARANFIDLAVADYEEDLAEIRADNNLGATEVERNTKIRQAKLFRKSISVVGTVLLLISIFFGPPRIIVLYYCAIASVLSLFGLVYFKGLIRMGGHKARVSLWFPIAVFAVLTGFIMMELGSTHFLPFWKESLLITGILTFLYLFFIVQKKGFTFGKVLMSFVLFFLLTYSSIRVFNVVLDTSEPESYASEILEIRRDISRRGLVSYQLYLKPWNTQDRTSYQVMVSKESHETIATGSIIEIKEHKGAFGAKWFTVHLEGKDLNDFNFYLF